MDEVRIRANAKINLGLDVVGKRTDGYHSVRLVMQQLFWGDDIRIQKGISSEYEGFRKENIFLRTRCAAPEEYYIRPDDVFDGLKDDENHLAYKAAVLMCDTFGIDREMSIFIEKRNPMGAGMGGGSADAAAVISGIDDLFALGLGEEKKRELSLCLGADVPFCIGGGSALCEGIGEIITKLPPLKGFFVLVIKPDMSISTGMMYDMVDKNVCHPDIDGLVDACKRADAWQVCKKIGNAMEDAAISVCPEVGRIKELIRAQDAKGVLMTGSGSAVYGLFRDESRAQNAFKAVVADAGERATVLLTGF